MPSRDRRLLAELEALYRQRRQVFFRVARAITGDARLAEEAVQEGFARAIKGRASFRGEGPLEAWVWRAVVNEARKAVRPLETEVSAAGDRPAVGEMPARELAPLIAVLPERQRTAIFLRYFADLDYRSIAVVLGVEVGTVSATLAAAHRTIRGALKEVVPGG